MEQPSEDSRSQDSSETDSLSSGEKDSLSSREDIQSSQEDSPESQTTQAGIPVPQRNTCTTRRRSRSLDYRLKHDEEFFHQQPIGSETCTMEFKSVLKFFKKDLRCNGGAFLSSMGGQLWFGVDDSGLVQGININFKQEDQYRRDADQILKKFNPNVLSGEFLMEFLPVRPGTEIPASETPDFKDLKVLRLTFTPVLTRLYEIEGSTYIRLQASVHTMTPSEIHEWYAQRPAVIAVMENRKLKRSIREALEALQTPDNEAREILNKALRTK